MGKRIQVGIFVALFVSFMLVLTPPARGEGGGTWAKVYDGSNVTNLFVLDEKTLWAVGENATILHSKDGGRTWQKRYEGGAGTLNALFMLNRHTGWAVGAGGLVITTNDGGKNWEKRPAAGAADYHCVSFSDENHGLIGGSAGNILATEDGGKQWRTQQFKFPPPTPEAPPLPNVIRVIGFSDPSHAIVLKDTDRVMITENGGKNWKVAGFPEGFSFGELYVRGNSAWIGGGRQLSSGTVLTSLWFSSDAGKTWRPVSFAKLMTRSIDAVWFADQQSGIMTVDGKLYRTSDGGQNWKVLYDGREKLHRIFARDLDHIWAIIAGGIYRYEAAGNATTSQ